MYIKDITGQQFGRLTAIENTRKSRKYEGCIWLCKCSCGKYVEVPLKRLRNGNTRSCGCLHSEEQSERRRKDISGMRFGSLVAIAPTEERKHGSIVWECKCDCGNTKYASAECLLSGNVKSCGCIRSRGNQRIHNILQKLNISFQPEYGVVINKHRYAYDFAIMSDGIPICLIEYDGVLHFEQTNFHGWNDEKNWELTKRNDVIKNQYAKDHGIPLIRIPYTEFNNLDENYLKERIKAVCTVDMSQE